MFRLAAVAVAALLALVLGGRMLLADEGRAEIADPAEASFRGVTKELRKATARSQAATRTPAWVEQGNALCRSEEIELDMLPQPRTLDELVRYLRRAIRIADHYEPRFRRLRVPADKRDELALLNGVSRQGRAILVEMLQAAERGDTAGVLHAADDAIALARRANPLVRRLGLNECALAPTGLAA